MNMTVLTRKKAIGVSLAVLIALFYGWSLGAWAQALPRGMKSYPPPKEVAISREVPVIDLPAGQKFVQYIPPYTSEAVMNADLNNAFITCDRDAAEKPRRYRYLKRGVDTKFYIQEH